MKFVTTVCNTGPKLSNSSWLNLIVLSNCPFIWPNTMVQCIKVITHSVFFILLFKLCLKAISPYRQHQARKTRESCTNMWKWAKKGSELEKLLRKKNFGILFSRNFSIQTIKLFRKYMASNKFLILITKAECFSVFIIIWLSRINSWINDKPLTSCFFIKHWEKWIFW